MLSCCSCNYDRPSIAVSQIARFLELISDWYRSVVDVLNPSSFGMWYMWCSNRNHTQKINQWKSVFSRFRKKTHPIVVEWPLRCPWTICLDQYCFEVPRLKYRGHSDGCLYRWSCHVQNRYRTRDLSCMKWFNNNSYWVMKRCIRNATVVSLQSAYGSLLNETVCR